MAKIKVAAAFVIFICMGAQTRAQDDLQKYAGREEMNGLNLKKYADFDRKWKLVTVRYRKDNQEQRFIYANDIAWKALKQGTKKFPEGSVFAKIGAATVDDPAFVSSSAPEGAVRYQLMVKNSQLYAETDGWGYALFDANGLTFPEEPRLKTMSCHACHKLVPDRDFVFAKIMEISPFTRKLQLQADLEKNKSRIRFAKLKRKDLPPIVSMILPQGLNDFDSVEGEIRDYIFDGTMSEIRPLLIKNTITQGRPSVLFNFSHTRFVVVYKDPNLKTCGSGNKGIPLQILHTPAGGLQSVQAKNELQQMNYRQEAICHE